MERIGLDLQTHERQLAIQAEDGTISERRFATSRERFTSACVHRPRATMLDDAGGDEHGARTEREWSASGSRAIWNHWATR
ncbi:MAG: hypothetical protein ABIZ91_19805 [Gemmatimonadaceae bacterium]